MCVLCGALGGKPGWGEQSGLSARREKVLREQVVARVLKHYGLELKPWAGKGYLLGRCAGPTQLAQSLSALWEVVERTSGISCDPLAPDLLSSLQAGGRASVDK
jgi:hypothetical protein